MLDIDGHSLSETRSILRYLAAKHGLHPLDAYDLWRVDSLVDHYGDIERAFFAVTLSTEKEVAMRGFIEKNLLPTLSVLETRLKKNISEDFFVGRKVTIADVVWNNFFWSYLTNEGRDATENQKFEAIVKNFPILWSYLKKGKTRFTRFSTRPPSSI